ncbi:MAG: SUMF1/EgtB/PvdO family nonheme iron enzyme [Fimbriimonadaceae bacterium]|nr:SUMF1/EgtB/PvdO family nonheme iron enzyme [Fimbriimonadaceae bacterium]
MRDLGWIVIWLGVSAAGAVTPAEQAAWQTAVVALRASAPGGVRPAEDAAGVVDGNRTQGFGHHTNQDTGPWWQVDLGSRQSLVRVVLYANHIPERLSGFELLLSDDQVSWNSAWCQTAKTADTPRIEVELNHPSGRYLRVRVPAQIWLHLSEVEVYAAADPDRNVALRQPALQSSVSQWSQRHLQLPPAEADWAADLTAGTQVIEQLAATAGPEAPGLRATASQLHLARTRLDQPAWVELHRAALAASALWAPVSRSVVLLNPAALLRALDDLVVSFPAAYPQAAGQRAAIAAASAELPRLQTLLTSGDRAGWERARALVELQRAVLLANPLLDCDQLLLVRRRADRLGLPANWQSNCVLPRSGYGNDLATLDLRHLAAPLRTVYRPAGDAFVGDVELHPSGQRLLLSQSHPQQPWQVYELPLRAGQAGPPRQVTPDLGADINNYDACYLPNGEILYSSTAPMVAVPCVNGSTAVANLFRLGADGSSRQLCFDQEHNWCPTVMNDGKILYLRWEYADLPHSNSRILFSMNPDGTQQMAVYGSSSYWPNGVFFARPVPGRPTQVVGIVTGHHGVARMGELVLFDFAKGRQEASGVVQRIPGWGQPVEPVVADQLVDSSWPKFLHPWPLGRSDGRGSGKFFLTAMQPAPGQPWGIYLVDVFDNLLLLREEPGYALLEPQPLQATRPAPVIPDKVNLQRKDGLVFLADIYAGPGLAGVPRGTVKSLRVLSYTYGYRGMGGLYGTIGLDGPWDVRRVLGTVPVESDGSAFFRVPANVPLAVQPLDAQGQALQQMRSWFTAMPGETISCVGCHESQNDAPGARRTLAARQAPTDLTTWYGQARGFAYANEVQPILDRRCVPCHNGSTTHQGQALFTLRGDEPVRDWKSIMPGHAGEWGGRFSRSYINLHRYVRHPGIESDMHTLAPLDYHASTTELVQTLRKGHQGVTLEREEWDKLIAWIDLNTPFHGDWATIAGDSARSCELRRAEQRKTYAGVDELHLGPPPLSGSPAAPQASVSDPPPAALPALQVTAAGAPRPTRTLDLGGGVTLELVWIPAGEGLVGSAAGPADERPATIVRQPRGFWLGRTEVTNQQYAQFDPRHDSRRESKQGYQFGVLGYPLFQPTQPVVRVAWQRAVDFCRWLGQRSGEVAELPSEAEWEYAARAGSATPFWWGAAAGDFAPYANLADAKTRELASDPYTPDTPLRNPGEYDDWLPKDAQVNDGALVSAAVGQYRPNPWGLQDTAGNVAEWTRSLDRPYPYDPADGREDLAAAGQRVVRGGSWRDRPQRATASFRLAYQPWQGVYNVGFRVLLRETGRPQVAAGGNH